MNLIDTFTEHERQGVETHFGTPWDKLTEEGKVMRGIIYRYTLSPKAIADMIMGNDNAVQSKRDGIE